MRTIIIYEDKNPLKENKSFMRTNIILMRTTFVYEDYIYVWGQKSLIMTNIIEDTHYLWGQQLLMRITFVYKNNI